MRRKLFCLSLAAVLFLTGSLAYAEGSDSGNNGHHSQSIYVKQNGTTVALLKPHTNVEDSKPFESGESKTDPEENSQQQDILNQIIQNLTGLVYESTGTEESVLEETLATSGRVWVVQKLDMDREILLDITHITDGYSEPIPSIYNTSTVVDNIEVEDKGSSFYAELNESPLYRDEALEYIENTQILNMTNSKNATRDDNLVQVAENHKGLIVEGHPEEGTEVNCFYNDVALVQHSESEEEDETPVWGLVSHSTVQEGLETLEQYINAAGGGETVTLYRFVLLQLMKYAKDDIYKTHYNYRFNWHILTQGKPNDYTNEVPYSTTSAWVNILFPEPGTFYIRADQDSEEIMATYMRYNISEYFVTDTGQIVFGRTMETNDYLIDSYTKAGSANVILQQVDKEELKRETFNDFPVYDGPIPEEAFYIEVIVTPETINQTWLKPPGNYYEMYYTERIE